MVITDLVDNVIKRQKRRERVAAVHQFAVGLGVVVAIGASLTTAILFTAKMIEEIQKNLKKKNVNITGIVRDSIKNGTENVKRSAAYVADGVSSVVEDVSGKMKDVKKDIKDGGCKVVRDMKKAAENISKNEIE